MLTICKLCGEKRDHSIRDNGTPASRCKECQRQYSKEHYAVNKAKHNKRRVENNKKSRLELREWLDSLKGGPCLDCGGAFPPKVLEFDHRGDKLFNISDAASMGWSRNRILQEIEKCDLVCANCHRIRTFY